MFGKIAAEPVAALPDQVIVVCYFSAYDYIINSCSIARDCKQGAGDVIDAGERRGCGWIGGSRAGRNS